MLILSYKHIALGKIKVGDIKEKGLACFSEKNYESWKIVEKNMHKNWKNTVFTCI